MGLRVNRYLVEILHILCGFWFLKRIVATGRQCCLVTVQSRPWVDLKIWPEFARNSDESRDMLLSLPLLWICWRCHPFWMFPCVLAYIMCAGINYVKSAWLVCIKLVRLERVSTFLTCKVGSLALAILKLHWRKKKKQMVGFPNNQRETT